MTAYGDALPELKFVKGPLLYELPEFHPQFGSYCFCASAGAYTLASATWRSSLVTAYGEALPELKLVNGPLLYELPEFHPQFGSYLVYLLN